MMRAALLGAALAWFGLVPAVALAGSGGTEGHAKFAAWLQGRRDLRIFSADVIATGTVCCATRAYYPEPESFGLLVDRVLKGPPAKGIDFVIQPAYADAPYFTNGEQVLVLLSWHTFPDGRRMLMAFHHDNKHVLPDERGGIWGGIAQGDLESHIDRLLAPRRPGALLAVADLVVAGHVTGVAIANEPVDLVIGRRACYAEVEPELFIKGTERSGPLTVFIPQIPRTSDTWERPPIESGDSLLLFLTARPDGLYEIAGGCDGVHQLGDSTTDYVLEQIGARIGKPDGASTPPPN